MRWPRIGSRRGAGYYANPAHLRGVVATLDRQGVIGPTPRVGVVLARHPAAGGQGLFQQRNIYKAGRQLR